VTDVPGSSATCGTVTRAALTAVLALVAGCAAQSSSPPGRPPVNLQGYPPAFRQGHADGCASGQSLLGRTRDEARYKSDGLYAQGWADGYSICKSR
jgi:hypothetical protein